MYVQIWSTKIEEKVQWMRFIATRMFMPDVEDATNTKDKVCNNLKRMLQVWQGKELKVEGKAGNKKGVAGSSKHLSAKEIGRIQMAERTEVKKTYEQWWQNALEQPVDETLWSVRILDKIDKFLKEAGSDKSKVLSANIWLTDISTWSQMNEVWDAWVSPGNTPARATVEAKLAGPEYLVEIVVVAARSR